jgi:biopolymer transport protein ExbD
MARKRKRKAEEPIKADMTPMIDVTFQLLIFFMLTIEFKTLEGKLAAYLPKDVGVNTSEAEPKEKIEIKIKVITEGSKVDPYDGGAYSGEGPFKYGTDREVTYSVGPRTTRSLDELRRRLIELYRADPEQPATIDPYPGTVYEDVVGILDIAILIGYRDITFIGAREAAPKK